MVPVLFGTNIRSEEVEKQFRKFLLTFKPVDTADNKDVPSYEYAKQLQLINETETYVLNLDCDHIYQFDK
jgi:hypothetical protein